MALLKLGSRGQEVQQLQLILNSSLIPSPHLHADGDFGSKTNDALIRFQLLKGLPGDGVAGPLTMLALGQKTTPTPAPAPVPGPATGPKWMQIATAELGIHENAMPGMQNKRIIEYHSATTLKAQEDEVPWCSSFVNWAMKQAGFQGSGSALAKSWLTWGAAMTSPSLGAVTVIKRKGASSDQATGSSTGFHVAFYISSTASHIRLLGGNQGDSVKYSNFSLAAYDVKGYRWPT